MVRTDSFNCAKCGAGLEVDPHHEVITCHYCGHRALIAEGRKLPPTQTGWPADHTPGRVARPGPQPRRLVAPLLAGVLAMASVALVIGVSVGLTRGRSAGSAGERSVVATDPRRVELADLIRQARAFAFAHDPHADRLTSAKFLNVQGALADTTAQTCGELEFPFHDTDPSRAPGQGDVVHGSLWVHVGDGVFRAGTTDYTFDHAEVADPTCSSRDAWAAAIKSGVPANAVTTFRLTAALWDISVDGHDEYRRQISAVNCALVGNQGGSADAPSTRHAASSTASASSCDPPWQVDGKGHKSFKKECL